MTLPANLQFVPRPASDVQFFPSVIPVQSIAPAASALVWVDISTTPATLKGWNGTAWVAIGGGTGGGLTTEDVDDRVAALIVAGTNITKTYNDTAGTLTLDAAGGLSGSGSPLTVVTPASVGIVYADTAATTGARLWVSTGTTNTSWKVIAGDTGQRLLSGFSGTDNGNLQVRRVNDFVILTINEVSLTATTNTDVYTLPAGFWPVAWSNFAPMNDKDVAGATASLVFCKVAVSPAGIVRFISHTTNDWYSVVVTWPTNAAWPTSLPGTAV